MGKREVGKRDEGERQREKEREKEREGGSALPWVARTV